MKRLKFDDLVDLYRTDPMSAEQYRHEMIEDFISSLPEERQKRIRCIQWRIDQELRGYRDPVAGMNRMVEMMWSGLFELNIALNYGIPLDKQKSDVITIRP